MNRTQRSIPLSPFFSLIFLFHFMACSPCTVRASHTSPFFDYCYDEHSKKITKGLSEDLLTRIIGYLPQKDALSLKSTSKSVYNLKHLFYVNNLYAKLSDACKALAPSDQPSSQHATLSFPYSLPIFIEHEAVLINFFKRDKYGVSLPQKDKKDDGNHSTNSLRQVHIKADDYLFNNKKITPLDFMMEKAVSLLSYHLFPQERLIAYSQIATFSNLHKVRIVEGHDTYLSAIPGLVQIAEKVEGIRLDEVLKQIPSQGYTAWYRDTFSLASYQSFVLLSLFMRPADYKANNIMLRKERDERGQEVYHLVGIDNDMAFADSLVEFHGATHVGVKNILYALPLMDEPFTEEVVQGIKGWNPALMVMEWLKDLDHYNQHYAPLFEGRFKDRYDAIPLWIAKRSLSEDENEECNFIYPPRFPLKLREGTALKLYKDLSHIKKVVEERAYKNENQQSLTLHQTFATLDPLLADYYKWLREEYKRVLMDQGQGAEQAYNHASGELYKNKKEWKTLEELFEQSVINHTLKPQLALSKDTKAYLKERTQPLETSLRELFNAITLDNILSAKKLTPTTLKWILMTIEPEIQELEFSLQILLQASPHINVENSLSLLEVLLTYCKSKLSKTPQGEGSYDAFLNRVDEFGRTVLHCAVNLSNSVGLKQIQSLVNFGANLEAQDKNKCTPLDLAADNKQAKIFAKLVSLGAGKKAISNKIRRFYAELSFEDQQRLSKIFSQLAQTNPKLEWQIALDTLVPSRGQGEVIRTVSEGYRYLLPEYAHALFDERGQIRKPNQHGRRSVPTLTQGPWSLHIKMYPELPGMELAVSRLMMALGYEAPYCELAEIRGHPALITQTIPGDTLLKVVCYKPECLQKLDPYHLSMALIMAMLTNPEDGNPTNYIVSPINKKGEESYKIISIDNDHAFMPAVAYEIKDITTKEKKLSLQVKTMLYCLDNMQQEIHPEVVKRFKALDPFKVLGNWLQDLSVHNKIAKAHFNANQVIELARNKDTIIGIPFFPGMLKQLYTKMVRLQMAFAKDKSLTHLKLLKLLEPRLGQRYENVHIAMPVASAWERFKIIDGPYYNMGNEGILSANASLSDVLGSSQIPDKEALQQALWKNEYSPEQALEELNIIQKQFTSYEEILKNLKQAEPDIFKNVQVEGLQEMLTHHIDFSALSLAQQQILLEGLQQKDLRKVHIINSVGLKDSSLQNLNFSHITHITLKGCSELKHFSRIRLILKNEPLELHVLKSLNVSECSKLIEIKVKAPVLQQVKASACSNLKTMEIESTQLKSIDLSQNFTLNDNTLLDFLHKISTFKVLNLESCPHVVLKPDFPFNKRAYESALAIYGAAAIGLRWGQYFLGLEYLAGKGIVQDYVKAREWFEKAAKQNNAEAQYNLGCMYINGDGVTQDYNKAREWYEKAAKQNFLDAQASLGVMYYCGQGIDQDYVKAREWFEKASKQNLPTAQYSLGVMYYYGQGVAQDYVKAKEWFFKAAEQNYSNAYYTIGFLTQKGLGLTQDEQKAQFYFQKAYELFMQINEHELAYVQHTLGEMYRYGRGVKKDLQKAVEWYQKAINQNYSRAQASLGSLYKEIQGNLEEALRLIKLAVEQKDPEGFYNLGLMYRDGEGVPQNDQEAIKLFELAVEQKHEPAFYSLGWMYEHGRDVDAKDLAKAQYWYAEAEKRYSADAFYSLGRMYELGLSVEKDLEQAVIWYKKAALLHHEDTKEKLLNLLPTSVEELKE